MKLEIKIKCSTCDEEMHHLVERGLKETILYTDPCPNCHPAKVTPLQWATVEVRNTDHAPECFITAKACGTRHPSSGLIQCYCLYTKVNNRKRAGVGTVYNVWRYPGEAEWRD